MRNLPKARSSNIVVQKVEKEILVYDLTTNKAYNLNETISLVYLACDGKTSINELKNATNFDENFIFLALDELKKESLLESDSFFASPFAGISRRDAIKKVGLTSMIALPIITSLVAPTATMAASTCSAVSCKCSNKNTTPNAVLCSLILENGQGGQTTECPNTLTCDCFVVGGNGSNTGTCTGVPLPV